MDDPKMNEYLQDLLSRMDAQQEAEKEKVRKAWAEALSEFEGDPVKELDSFLKLVNSKL